MTVPENLSPKTIYNGPVPIKGELPITFPYTEKDDVKVFTKNADLTYNVDYTVVEQTVIINVEVPEGDTVTVYRRTPLDQQAEFPQKDIFDSAKMNEALDKLCMQQQEQNEEFLRTVKVPISTDSVFNGGLPPLEANKGLKVNSDGTGFIYTELDPDLIGPEAIAAAERAKKSAEEAEASNVAAADQAQIATDKAQEALASEVNAKKYANGTVEEYPEGSAEHWAGTARDTVLGFIKDDTIGLETTYSSQNIEKKIRESANGLEILDIGIAPFGINEAENLRRYLNGQTILQSQFKVATKKIKEKMATMPNLFCTNEEFEAELTMSAKGQCGKFVIDDVAGTIRLPKVVNIQGLFDLQNAGLRVEAGLPNITGSQIVGLLSEQVPAKGCIRKDWSVAPGSPTNGAQRSGYSIDASLSNPIYGKSETVQEEAIQYPYFIQVATDATEKDSVINEYQLNNPYSLLDCKWSDHKLTNISWLLSDGQLKSGTTYKAVYDLLLKEYNSSTDITEELFGVSITYRKGKETGLRITTNKTAYDNLLEKTGTAWFYVLDTAQTGFYLPQTNGMLQFGGTGEFIEAGLPNITGGVNMVPAQTTELNKQWGSGAFKKTRTSSWNNCQSGGGSQPTVNSVFDASDSDPIYGKSTTVQPNAIKGYLYFYVGETVENANLIDAGKMQGQLVNKADKVEVPHLAMPSDKYIDLPLSNQDPAPADGYYTISRRASGANQYLGLNNGANGIGVQVVSHRNDDAYRLTIQARKGDLITVNNSFGGQLYHYRFVYAQGEI